MPNQTRHVVKRLGRGKFEIVEIAFGDIRKTKMEGGHAVYYMKDGNVYHDIATMEELHAMLAGKGFRQVERCYLANMEQVTHYDADRHVFMFDDEDYVPISRSYEKQFKAEGLIESKSTTFGSCQLPFNMLNGAGQIT